VGLVVSMNQRQFPYTAYSDFWECIAMIMIMIVEEEKETEVRAGNKSVT
jgi:hypothetical protein